VLSWIGMEKGNAGGSASRAATMTVDHGPVLLPSNAPYPSGHPRGIETPLARWWHWTAHMLS